MSTKLIFASCPICPTMVDEGPVSVEKVNWHSTVDSARVDAVLSFETSIKVVDTELAPSFTLKIPL